MTGRDFVVGDLHGSLRLLEIALEGVHFDRGRDRLFSVGDLVDRGQNSLGCLQLLQEPWFHCVRGNHEDLMLDFLDDGHQYGSGSRHAWLDQANGSGWYFELWHERAYLEETLVPILRRQPLFLTVPLPDGRQFHVVHAEIVTAGYDMGEGHLAFWTDDTLSELPGEMERTAFVSGYGDVTTFRNRLLWGRSQVLSLNYGAVPEDELLGMRPGLSPIYCGHTILPGPGGGTSWPLVLQSHVLLDTGAYQAGRDQNRGLTVAEPLTGGFWFFGAP
ncbi:metallophosphoesterase [Thiomonas sp.]